MQSRSFRNSAIAAVAVSVVSALTALWTASVMGQRDAELGARGRNLSRVQRFTISCGRATRLAAECTVGAPNRGPEVLRDAMEACDRHWAELVTGTSPAFAPQLERLREVGNPLRITSARMIAQCGNGANLGETTATLSTTDERFERVVNDVIAETEAEVRKARAAWDVAHRRIKIAAICTGLWGIGVAVAMMLSVRRIRETRVALASEQSRASELDAFASRAAHDLRGMLTPLPYIASALVRAQGDNERLEVLARRLEGTSRRAARMIDALLAFARLGHAGTAGSCEVPAVVDDILLDLQPMVSSVGAEVRIEGVAGKAQIDAALFYAVLMNVVNNALKFMRDRPQRTLTLRGRELAHEVELVVADTGPGIPPEDLERVFEPFYRSQPGPIPGVGLGLATVAKIVHAHGGTVRIDSEIGQGTRVILRLPSERPPERAAPSEGNGHLKFEPEVPAP